MKDKFVVCITGASGSIYGIRLIEELQKVGEVYVVVSSSGYLVLKEELGLTREKLKKQLKNIKIFKENDFTSPLASGSQLIKFKGVVIIPCSMSTLGNIANGINANLIHRIGEVALKERVKLILAIRESPYSLIHIENMKKVTLSGGIIAPLSPAFYHSPSTIEDLVNFSVGKILDLLEVPHDLFKRWKNTN